MSGRKPAGVLLGLGLAAVAVALGAAPARAAPDDVRLQALTAQLMYLQWQSLAVFSGLSVGAGRPSAEQRGGDRPSAGAAAEATGDTMALRLAVTAAARSHLGTVYRWGGTGTGGFDCSGLVVTVFAAHGIRLPRSSREQAQVGEAIALEEAQPGDLLFFAYGRGGVDHAGLYLGDHHYIHASSSARGVVISELTAYQRTRLVVVRRVLGAGVARSRAQSVADALIGWPGSDEPGPDPEDDARG